MFKKNVFYSLNNQSGQALLIIVLVMVVALTVGLSVASRTLTNLRTTREQVNSQQALSAAEAGVEQAIKNSSNVAGSFSSGGTTYTTSITSVLGTSAFLLNGNNKVQKDDPIYVWITPYNSDPTKLWQTTWSGALSVYWGDGTGDCNNAALEVIVISGSKNAPVVTKSAIDPCATRRSNNNFGNPAVSNTTISGIQLFYKKTITITNGLLVRVYPLYTNSYVGIIGVPAAGNPSLPAQGSIITSTGSTANNSVQRKVNVYQGYPELPAELFPYTLFSP